MHPVIANNWWTRSPNVSGVNWMNVNNNGNVNNNNATNANALTLSFSWV